MKRYLHLTGILLLVYSASFAQVLSPYTSGNIEQKLKKLNTLGTALYVAAHPDDENTQLIAYLANGRHFRTGYLAATRGDGGQNLIGPEIREKLGVIRTQELLAARRTDNGQQFFSRANDFGYSKDPDETFNIWDKEKVLADFVWTIRKFRPDVLITRFSLQPGITHGHHTASAVLAMEAFEASGDPSRFPEQLADVDVWQPKKIFWNTSPWFFRNTGAKFDPEEYVKVDVGEFNSSLGYSYTEIAALSRSMHKSQGFGNSGSRGSEFEYFKQWGGENTGDLFGGIDTSWKRVKGAEGVAKSLKMARDTYSTSDPSEALKNLLIARQQLLTLSDQFWKEVKLKELEEVIQLISGTYLALNAVKPAYVPGDSIKINLEAINRSPFNLSLNAIRFSLNNERFVYNMEMEDNQSIEFTYDLIIPDDMSYTNPYWLEQPGTEGMYQVDDQLLRGLPENNPAVMGYVSLGIEDQVFEVPVPVQYRRTDPVKGEVITPLIIKPEAMINLDAKALIFSNADPKPINVTLIAGRDNLSGTLQLDIPDGWKSSPEQYDFEASREDEEIPFEFLLTPPSKASEGIIKVSARINGQVYQRGRSVIDYDHIPKQTLFQEATAKVVKLDARHINSKIGYIMGAGDDMPANLEQVGYQVTQLDKDQVVASELAAYDAVILGIRAFNTLPWLSYKNQELFDYVKNGGTMIVQYNTSHRLVTEEVAPFDLKLSRDRVTVENAPVEFLSPKHQVLNQPNRITQADMEGWVQERGLYFPNEWSADLQPILGMNDPGEEQTKGSLLVGKYGEGYYCYTGISFFRELPAGVSGAYRLFMNIIDLGKSENP